jgi:tRNA 2-thiouridine synthesizing protein A
MTTASNDPAGLPQADAVMEMLEAAGQRQGAICAVLTPALKRRLAEMQPGQVLELRVDDPTARVDVEAWSQLTGHRLLAVAEEPPNLLRFFLRKRTGTD